MKRAKRLLQPKNTPKEPVQARTAFSRSTCGDSRQIAKTYRRIFLIKLPDRQERSIYLPGMYLYPRAFATAAIGSRIFRTPDGEVGERVGAFHRGGRSRVRVRAYVFRVRINCSSSGAFFPPFLRFLSSAGEYGTKRRRRGRLVVVVAAATVMAAVVIVAGDDFLRDGSSACLQIASPNNEVNSIHDRTARHFRSICSFLF